MPHLSNSSKSRRANIFIACFAVGYLLWQLDFRYCSELTSYKRQMGMPWSFLLEFHGYWHILTSIGAYTFMAMVEDLTYQDKGKSSKTS